VRESSRFRASAASLKLRSFVPGLALALVALLAPRVGNALPEIPGEMKDVMQLDCTPTCLLCHTDEDGGEEDLNPYGREMLKFRVTLDNGVATVWGPTGYAATSDFDHDGVMDRDEIIANTDPRTTDTAAICNDAVYGCFAQVAPGSRKGAPAASPWALVSALSVAALLLRLLRRT